MKVKSERSISLYLEWFLLLFFSGLLSVLFFVVSSFVIEQQIDRYYENRNIVQKHNEKYISKLQRYVSRQRISSEELQRLDEWISHNRLIYIQIRKDGKWVYFSDFSMDEIQSEEYDFSPYPSDSYYDIELSDGTVQVFIMGMYSYNAYTIALVAGVIASCLLFLVLTMFGIRRKIRYINQLSRDIEILEGGNLEYEVYALGNDEITNLARGLNAMRISFKNQIEEIECLTKTNQEMVTEISHDLRTPLTSVLLYAEILQNKKCKDEEQKQKYLEKIIKKIQFMKDLSDRLLEYSACNVEEKQVRTEYISSHRGLYEELSDMCHYLEERGLKVKADMQWEKGQMLVCEEYLIRILDNISSNILKYADAQAPVLIWDEYYEDEMCIAFENACINGNVDKDSYSIGMRNVKMMMMEMDGRCEVAQTQEKFRVCLRFQYKKD
ncbi:MAG: HAMP domain-containing histidine kinase [Lachnospiraceae bacterium]|nr:HAMP domain-containing histidine kinase [Lachnospiraceae bacterium]